MNGVLLVVTAWAVIYAQRNVANPGPVEKIYRPLRIVADSLVKTQGVEPADAWADSVQKAAAARRDRPTEVAMALWRGVRWGAHESDYERAAPFFARAFSEGQALRDTFVLVTVFAERGLAGQTTGRQALAKKDYLEAVRYARKSGFTNIEGYAHRGLGAIFKDEGDYGRARRELELAVRQLPVESFENLHSQLILGEMLRRTGYPDDARERFEEVLAEARRRNSRYMIGAAMQDLGIVSFEQGDMAAADRYWFAAAAQYDTLAKRKVVGPGAAIDCRVNRAHALVVLGRLPEAGTILDRLLAESADLDDQGTRYSCLSELGVMYRKLGQYDRAERSFRASRAGSAGTDAMEEEGATLELVGVLRETGRLGEASDLLDSLLVPERRVRMTADNQGCALIERSAIERERGRNVQALAAAREGERIMRAKGTKPSIYWLDGVVELARAQRANGKPDSAVATLARASREWEKWRAQISSLEWRERAGAGLAGLFAEYGLALLDPRRKTPEAQRARQAFDALQVFQARTLEERMHGAGLAGRSMAARVSADSLRTSVLRPGEVMLDFVSTPDTTFAFVVTRTGTVARLLPGARRLDPLYADWRSAMLGGADTPVVDKGLARLSSVLLAPVAPALAGAKRIIVTGGGSVALWPVGALTLPGEKDPVGVGREIASAPSATLFALLRKRAGQAQPGTLLALCRTTDAAGKDLPGAERELTLLDRNYTNVVVRKNPSVEQATADLGKFEALHFAAHAEASEVTPWRSGFLLGAGTGENAYLRASSVARLKLKARLAVLSGCQSAGATALAGEGAIGLSSGFLSAGTTTVVATLWPVEDRTAERYMAAFYASLARGRPVAAAAREARAALRDDSANPRDWAAFVVLGEPSTVFPLKARGRA